MDCVSVYWFFSGIPEAFISARLSQSVIVFKYSVKIVTTLIALGLISYTIDRELFWKSIRSADIEFLWIAILLFFPIQFLSAYRWYFILSLLNQLIPFRTVLHHSVFGQLSSLVLPGQVSGDILKLLAASRGQKAKVPIILSVVIDKLALLLGVAIFVILGVFGLGPVSSLMVIHLTAVITIMLAIPVMFVLCQYRKDPRDNKLLRFVARSVFLRDNVLKRIGDLPTLPYIPSKGIIKIIVSALFLLGFHAAGAYFVALSMHIQINPVDWVAINAIVAFVQIFPVTVGGLGIREGTYGMILSLYGVSFSQAVVFSLTGFVLGAILTSLFWLALDSTECAIPVK